MDILIITDYRNDASLEDFYIAQSFGEDGHNVTLKQFSKDLDLTYDVIIHKNSWDESNFDTYRNDLKEFNERLLQSKSLVVNSLDGKFDNIGKKCVEILFKKGYKVIPTITNMKDVNLLPKVEEYIVKPIDGYDGFGMKTVKFDNLSKLTLNNEIVQPKEKFIAEVQFYFVNDKFQYCLEYTPHKWPSYPKPKLITPTKEEIANATEIVKQNKLSCGFQRVDFLRLEDNSLLMLECADRNPHLSFIQIDENTRNKTIKAFKTAVYEYVNEKTNKIHKSKSNDLEK